MPQIKQNINLELSKYQIKFYLTDIPCCLHGPHEENSGCSLPLSLDPWPGQKKSPDDNLMKTPT
jgi:hypothetical protein